MLQYNFIVKLYGETCSKTLVELITSNITVNIRYIIIDAIHIDAGRQYNNKHSAEELIDLGLAFKLIKTIKNLDKFRDLLVFERASSEI